MFVVERGQWFCRHQWLQGKAKWYSPYPALLLHNAGHVLYCSTNVADSNPDCHRITLESDESCTILIVNPTLTSYAGHFIPADYVPFRSISSGRLPSMYRRLGVAGLAAPATDCPMFGGRSRRNIKVRMPPVRTLDFVKERLQSEVTTLWIKRHSAWT